MFEMLGVITPEQSCHLACRKSDEKDLCAYLHKPKTVLWSSSGIGGGRKQGGYFQTKPLARPKPASYTKKTAAGSGTRGDRFSLDLDPVALSN